MGDLLSYFLSDTNTVSLQLQYTNLFFSSSLSFYLSLSSSLSFSLVHSFSLSISPSIYLHVCLCLSFFFSLLFLFLKCHFHPPHTLVSLTVSSNFLIECHMSHYFFGSKSQLAGLKLIQVNSKHVHHKVNYLQLD